MSKCRELLFIRLFSGRTATSRPAIIRGGIIEALQMAEDIDKMEEKTAAT